MVFMKALVYTLPKRGGWLSLFAYSTLNYPFRADKIGTVGNAGHGIELKIAEDEEILVRGKGLFSGY